MHLTTKIILHVALLASSLIFGYAKESTLIALSRHLRARGGGLGAGGAGAGVNQQEDREDSNDSYLISLVVGVDLAPNLGIGEMLPINAASVDTLSIVTLADGNRQPITGRVTGSAAGTGTPGEVFVSYTVTLDEIAGEPVGPFVVSGFVESTNNGPQSIAVLGTEVGTPTMEATDAYSFINVSFVP